MKVVWLASQATTLGDSMPSGSTQTSSKNLASVVAFDLGADLASDLMDFNCDIFPFINGFPGMTMLNIDLSGVGTEILATEIIVDFF